MILSRIFFIFLLSSIGSLRSDTTCHNPFPLAQNSTVPVDFKLSRGYLDKLKFVSLPKITESSTGSSLGYVTQMSPDHLQLRTMDGDTIADAWITQYPTTRLLTITDCQGNSLAHNILAPYWTYNSTTGTTVLDYAIMWQETVVEGGYAPDENGNIIFKNMAFDAEIARFIPGCPQTDTLPCYWQAHLEQYRSPFSSINDPRVATLLMATLALPQRNTGLPLWVPPVAIFGSVATIGIAFIIAASIIKRCNNRGSHAPALPITT